MAETTFDILMRAYDALERAIKVGDETAYDWADSLCDDILDKFLAEKPAKQQLKSVLDRSEKIQRLLLAQMSLESVH